MSDTEPSEHSPELDNLEGVYSLHSTILDTHSNRASSRNEVKSPVKDTSNEPESSSATQLSPTERSFSKSLPPTQEPTETDDSQVANKTKQKSEEEKSGEKEAARRPTRTKRVREPIALESEEPEPKQRSPRKSSKRKRASQESVKPKEERENKEEEIQSAAETQEKKKPKRKEKADKTASVICQLLTSTGEPGCKQRAILGYRFCIRHILNDPDSPYQQCAHTRRPKNKSEAVSRCTNAIRKDSGETFCSTHLIMAGLKEAKKKTSATESNSGRSSPIIGEDGNLIEVPMPIKAFPPLQVYKEPESKQIVSEPLPPLNIPLRQESHLMRALTSPAGAPISPMKPPDSLLRSVLETKVDFRMLNQRYTTTSTPIVHQPMSLEITSSDASASASYCSPNQEEPPPPPPPEPYKRTDEDWKHLFRLMTPQCKQAWVDFFRREKERQARGPTVINPPPQAPKISKTLKPELVARIEAVWAKLDKTGRKKWAASMACRAGIKAEKGQLPFSSQDLESANPHLAKQMIAVRKIGVPPTRIECQRKNDTVMVNRGAPAIRLAVSDSSSDEEDLHPDVKQQVRKMVGPYREIYQINEMCNKMERADFDKHNMFPLGFESTDEEDSDEEAKLTHSVFPSHPVTMASSQKDREMDLYNLRRQLRLERHQLMTTAQVNAPIMNNIKKHTMSVGAALRQQLDRGPTPAELIHSTVRRCCQVENKQRCERACLPSSNHCSIHVLYNVNQKLFQFCTHPQFCRRPVLAIDAMLWDGKCKLHRESRLEKFGPYPVYHDLETVHTAGSVASSLSQSDEESGGEREDEDVDDEDDGRSAGTP